MAFFFLLCLYLAFTLTARAQTATISLGDIQQYEGTATSTPVLNGTQIAYADSSTDDGIDVFISPALQSAIQAAQNDKCQSSAQECVRGVQDLLYNPNTEIQSRQLAAAALSLAAYASAFITVLFASYLYVKPEPIPAYVHLPVGQMIGMSSAGTATVTVVSVDSSAAFTITAQPISTVVTGSFTPAVTTFSAGVDGHTQGDVVFSMSNELAARLDDFIRRSTECDAGTVFDSSTLSKRGNGYGDVLCASEGVIMNAVPDGPFGDFQLLNPQPLLFAAADALRAMNAAMDFARAYAPALNLDLIAAGTLGVAAFALAWEVLRNGQTLGAQNLIPAQSLSGTITAPPSPSSAASTASVTCSSCVAGCYFVGWMQACSTTCTEASSCVSSASQDAIDYGGEEISTTTIEAWTVYGRSLSGTNIPSSTVFVTVPPVSLTTSSPTTEISSPPPTTSSEVPTTTTSPPPPPPPPPTPTPTLGGQNCNGVDSYPKHPDIHEGTVTRWLNQIVCVNDETFTSATKPIDWNPNGLGNSKQPYHYRISWIEGCVTTESSQRFLKPLPEQPDVTCYSLLYQDYKNCINGGVGGWRDAGCLRYEFNPSTA